MAEPRPLFLGPRIRRLRRELGLTQQVMAEDLKISPSYVALLERNQRPVTADMLLRLARTYRIDVADLASEDGEDYQARVSQALRDPLFAGIDLPPLEVADLAMSFPGISEALLRLHGAYQRAQSALADRQGADTDEAADPVRWIERFLAQARNHFPTLEDKAEALAAEVDGAGGLEPWLVREGVRVRYLPPEVLAGSMRRFDRHNQQLLIDDTLDGPSRRFQMATQVAHTAMRADVSALLRAQAFPGPVHETLARRALAGYAAAALIMPYGRFARAVEARRYDVEALAPHFGASFEQVAHRLTTLHRPGAERVPFFFLRVDEAGNVSKRLDGAGFPFAAHGGRCPLWSVHSAFRRPGEVVTQWLELPDGARFFSIARTVTTGTGRHGGARVLRAVALACAAEEADRLVYAGSGSGVDPTPIGIACRLCPRAECVARSAPPIGRDILVDDYRRGLQPYSFAEG
jgi:XRE family transcriptional regulator, fatty acid utilization regulator